MDPCRAAPALAELFERPTPLTPPARMAEPAAGPVALVRLRDGSPAVLVSRWEEIRRILQEPAVFSSVDAPFGHLIDDRDAGTVPAGSLLGTDGEAHTRLRRRLARHFTTRRMAQFETAVRDVVDHVIDDLASGPAHADLELDFSQRVSAGSISALLGLSTTDADDFIDWSREVNDMRSTPSRRRRADGLIRQYVTDRLADEQRSPTGSLFGSLLAEQTAEDPLTDAELITIGSTLVVAGQDTTANAISLAVLAMMQTPGMVREIDDQPGFATSVCEEFLRYHSIVHLGIARRTVTATEIAGRAVPAGTAIVCSLADANFDAARFPDPARFDARREPNRHLAFGHGPHLCLGQHLARVEMIQSITRIARRVPTMRPAVPLDALTGKPGMTVFGIASLPVTWDQIQPAGSP